ncbi:hypothetical protein [Clostridium sartagoforme]|nr:hypothetical protein [Clostridium sartagoforme]
MKKRIFKVFTALFMVAIILVGIILIQNDFKIVEKSVDIKTSKGILKGT